LGRRLAPRSEEKKRGEENEARGKKREKERLTKGRGKGVP